MPTLHIQLTDDLAAHVQARVASGEHPDAASYIASLILADSQISPSEEIDRLLLEGLRSGPPITPDDAYWQSKRERLTRGRK